jgi:amino-acid N-acetyltransferase
LTHAAAALRTSRHAADAMQTDTRREPAHAPHEAGNAPTHASANGRREPVATPLAALVLTNRPVHGVLLRRAVVTDADVVFELLDGYVKQGLVLPRTRAHVAGMIEDFMVAWDGVDIVGCAALRRYSPLLAEVGGLAVAAHWQGQGIGRLLVEALIDEATASDCTRVFALTLQESFFHRLGFRTTNITAFPEKIARDCAVCTRRNACPEICVVRDLGAVH